MLIEGITLSDAFLNYPVTTESLFCELTPTAARKLARIKKISLFEKGGFLLSKGKIPSKLCALLQGEAEIIAGEKLSAWKFSRLVARNEIMGLTEMLARKPFDISVKAKTPCLCENIARRDFIRFIQTEPKIAYQLIELLGLNFQKSYRALYRR